VVSLVLAITLWICSELSKELNDSATAKEK